MPKMLENGMNNEKRKKKKIPSDNEKPAIIKIAVAFVTISLPH